MTVKAMVVGIAVQFDWTSAELISCAYLVGGIGPEGLDDGHDWGPGGPGVPTAED